MELNEMIEDVRVVPAGEARVRGLAPAPEVERSSSQRKVDGILDESEALFVHALEDAISGFEELGILRASKHRKALPVMLRQVLDEINDERDQRERAERRPL